MEICRQIKMVLYSARHALERRAFNDVRLVCKGPYTCYLCLGGGGVTSYYSAALDVILCGECFKDIFGRGVNYYNIRDPTSHIVDHREKLKLLITDARNEIAAKLTIEQYEDIYWGIPYDAPQVTLYDNTYVYCAICRRETHEIGHINFRNGDFVLEGKNYVCGDCYYAVYSKASKNVKTPIFLHRYEAIKIVCENTTFDLLPQLCMLIDAVG